MQKKLLASLLLVGFLVAPLAARPEPDSRDKAWRAQGLQLKAEIENINLVNGLLLTREQARKLLPLAQKSASLRQQMDERIDGRRDVALATLQKMHDELLQGGQPSPETARQYHDIAGQLEQERAEFLTGQEELARQARGVLQENQLALVARARLCLVPPEDARLPRAGQAGAASHLEEVLERARSLSKEELAQRKATGLPKIRAKLVTRFGPQEADKKLAQIERVIDQARAMSDAEFALRKADLVQSLGLEHDDVRDNPEVNRLVAEHLLGPGSVAALQRLVQTAQR